MKPLRHKTADRPGNKRARRKRHRRTLAVLSLVLLILGAGGAGWAWWREHHWLPDRALYPVQGIEVGAGDGEVNWRSAHAIGVNFAYIDASSGAGARDPRFVANFEAARAAGVEVGAVHRYDPCRPAQDQAGNFVTTVPRDDALLPPAVELSALADDCPTPVSDAKVESELMTFLNQVETHSGRPTILKVTKAFEERYGIARRLDRNIWLVRDRFVPNYAGRSWSLWTASDGLTSEIAQGPLRWVVVRP